ncbi:MAG: AraC family transcriptional regulator [Bacteroidota bacterium]
MRTSARYKDVLCNWIASEMDFNFLNILVLSGIMLSLFLVVLLWSSQSFRSDVNSFFGLSIISLNFSLTVTWFEELVPSNGILEIINWQFLFPFAFMLYVLKAIKDPLGATLRIWLLLVPCLVLSIFHIIDFAIDFDVYEWLSGGDEEQYFYLIEAVSFSLTPYSIILISFSYFKVRKVTGIYPKEKRWLKFNSVTILVFYLVWLFSDYLAELFNIDIWEYLLAFLGLFLTIITYRGVQFFNIFEQQRQIDNLLAEPKKRKPVLPENGNNREVSKKLGGKIEKLHSLMIDEQLYRNPALTRGMVAQKLELSEGYLSELINNSLKTNFNDYINEHRVNQVIKMLNDRNFEPFSIEAIGYESGFKTKSVFYKAFKKVTGKTPGEHRKSLNLS